MAVNCTFRSEGGLSMFLFRPIQYDIHDIEIVRAIHHHVRDAVEPALKRRVIQRDISRRGGSKARQPSSVDAS